MERESASLDVTLLGLPPSIREKLRKAGFRSSFDLFGIQPVDLASGTSLNTLLSCDLAIVVVRNSPGTHMYALMIFPDTEAQLTHEEAVAVLNAALSGQNGGVLAGFQSAHDIYEKEKRNPRIITLSPDLDRVLGGGIPSGQITEFCGAPGVGKTQIGMQLCVNVQLPKVFGGNEGETIYIDTEGSFSAERCMQMAHAFVKHLKRVAEVRNDDVKKLAAEQINAEKILDSIHYFRVRDSVEQLCVVEILKSFIQAHPNVKLVVMDSVAFHFRQDFEDLASRTRRLGQMSQTLMSVANEFHIAIVMMNHVTTRVSDDGPTRLVPALGDSWAHAATNRLICYWKGDSRFAFLFKSPSLPAKTGEYRVSKDGIRGSLQAGQSKRKSLTSNT